jgi:two-component system response regulator YesN
MIVDDERMTRDSLAKYVAWSTVNIGSVRTARNGIEALAIAHQDPPEILLTDVRMPKMDGFELAEQVKCLNPFCKVVFLSGFADKEYLKKAIHLQAISYVEKPVNLEEVKEAVRRAVTAFERDAGERREAERIRTRSREVRAVERDEITRRLVTGDREACALLDSPSGAPRVFEPDTSFTVGAVRVEWSADRSESEKAGRRRKILMACGEVAPFNLSTSLLGFVESDVLAIVVARKIAQSQRWASNVCNGLIAILREQSEDAFTASVGIGVPVRGLAALPLSYASARESLGLHFYREKEQVFFPVAGRPERFSVRKEDFTRFRESLHVNDIEQAISLVHEIEAAARRVQALDVDSVRDAFFTLHLIVVETLWNRRPAGMFGEEERTYIWQEIREQATLTELTRFVLHRLWTAFGGPAEPGRLSRKIREIQRFVRDNYMQTGLTLGVIAEHAGLSRTYLSSLYKAATGQNVIEYLTELRIEKAKELLLDGRTKTHEVALSVGYRDADYFSALFKKRVGTNPSAYRESE